jgi:probable phosphoglycerate mutase
MQPVRIVMVRHGEARAGVDRIIGGERGCRGLTDVGREQAAAVRDRLAATGEIQPDVMYASTLARARETAEIISAAFPHLAETRIDADLCELVPGECDGMPYEEAVAQFAPDIDSPDVAMSPGGETTREFDARVRRALRRLVDTHANETVVVVTHGGFIAAACMYVLGAPGLAEVYPFRLWPANVSITSFVAETEQPPWLLERYNDTAHVASPTTKAW